MPSRSSSAATSTTTSTSARPCASCPASRARPSTCCAPGWSCSPRAVGGGRTSGSRLPSPPCSGARASPTGSTTGAPPTTTTGRRCGRCARSTSTTCSRDGTALPAAHLPRRRRAGGAGTGGIPAADRPRRGRRRARAPRAGTRPATGRDGIRRRRAGRQPVHRERAGLGEVGHGAARRGGADRAVRELVTRQVPFLGLCYGVGATSLALGGVVDRTYGERVGTTTVRVTEAGRDDLIFGGLPEVFAAFVGHKEAATEPPPGAVVVATSDACPVQAYRVGPCAWVTQFHPELEAEAFVERIRAYAHLGYFRPDEQDAIIDVVRAADTSAAHDVLRRFVAQFA